jgi:acyl carrier protein
MTMPTEKQVSKLIEILENTLNVWDVSLSPRSTLRDFCADELDCCNFFLSIEEEFKTDLDYSDISDNLACYLDRPIFDYLPKP